MKQRIIIALALAIVLLFSACSDSSTSETIENFKKSLCDSNYTQATTIYNDAEETEKSELQAVIKEVANTTIIDYLNDTIDYSKAISTLEKIQQIILKLYLII